MQKNLAVSKKNSDSLHNSPPKSYAFNDELNSSAHFGSGEDASPLQNPGNIDPTELKFQLTRSNNITKKLASVFSSLVSKIKDLEAQNSHITAENE